MEGDQLAVSDGAASRIRELQGTVRASAEHTATSSGVAEEDGADFIPTLMLHLHTRDRIDSHLHTALAALSSC